MKYCLRGLLGNEQRKAVFQYIDVCCKVLAEKQSVSAVPDLLAEMNSALAVLERDMPVTIQVSVRDVYRTSYCDESRMLNTCIMTKNFT